MKLINRNWPYNRKEHIRQNRRLAKSKLHYLSKLSLYRQRNLRLIQLSRRNQLNRRLIQLSRRNQLNRRLIQLSPRNQLLRRQTQFSQPNKQIGGSFQQMNKKIGIQNLFLGKPVQLSQPNQMVKPRQPFHQNQFWGRPIKKPLTNQNSKIQRLKALQKSNNRRNQPKRERFYTPQELLKLAPIHDKAMWQLIISRLPTDYRLPDPEFVKIYKNFFKSK